MLEIIVNGKKCDLGNTSINFTFRNPIFESDGLPKGYSYPFKLPRTPRNNQIFEHSYRLDVKGKRLYDCTIRLYSHDMDIGKLTLRSTTDNYYSFNFSVSVGISDELLDSELSTVLDSFISTVTPSEQISNWEVLTNTSFLFLGFPEYSIEINGQLFSAFKKDHLSKHLAVISLVDKINEVWTNVASYNLSGDFTTISLAPTSDMQPFNVDSVIGFNDPSGDIEDWQRHKTLFEQHLTDLDGTATVEQSHHFPTLFNELYFEEANRPASFTGTINPRDASGNIIHNQEYTQALDNDGNALPSDLEYLYVPFLRLGYVIKEICKKIGTTPTGDFFSSEEASTFIFHTSSINKKIESTPYKWASVAKISFDLQNFLPGISARDLFKKVRETFSISFKKEGNLFLLNFIADELKQSPSDWSLYAIKGHTTETTEEESVEYYFEEEDNDPLAPLDATEGTAVINTLASDTELDFVRTEQPGGSDFNLRLFKGLSGATEFNTSPYATIDDIYENNAIRKRIAEQSDTINKLFKLPIAKLLAAKDFKNSIVRLETEEGNVTTILKTINFKADVKGVGLAKCELVGLG